MIPQTSLLTRRTFVAAAGACAAVPLMRARGANDAVRTAILGLGNKGPQTIGQLGEIAGVRIAALCDPDRGRLEAHGRSLNLTPEALHTDMRRIFDDKTIDAVFIVTPNHWHALATIWACQAGKDVYVEKPCSHTIWEGRQMIAAARKHGRIVQVGTQRRSDENLRDLFGQLRGGELGKILRVRVLHYSRRGSIGKVKREQPVPAGVDYNLWAGPAPMSPIRRKEFHYDWHWFWETGYGELGNNGPHALDLARWVLGYDHLAPRVMSIGGRYVWDDDGQTPNTHIVVYDYEPAPIIAEIRNLPDKAGSKGSDVYRGLRTGIIVECEGGYFAGMNGGAIYDNKGQRIRSIDGDGGRHHPANFIKAVRSRKVEDLTCDIAEGHLSTALCHQGNISHRLGVEGPITGYATRGSHDESEALGRMLEHLKANEVDLATTSAMFGRPLSFDPKTERFTGEHAAAANAHLRGKYREPFVVPEGI